MDLNRTPEKAKQTLVVADDNLPARLPVIQYTLLYVLFADRFDYPLWLNIVVGALLILAVIGITIIKARETPVDIFKR